MFGKNPIRKPVNGSGDALEIVSIFPTIQGEGPRAGQPAIFIRLGGCNLACSFCDTEFEDFKSMTLDTILNTILELSSSCSIRGSQKMDSRINLLRQGFGGQESENNRKFKLIIITGGEPLRQPIEQLCSELIKLGYTVQIETNGTLFRPLPPEVEIVCSPKLKDIRPDLHERVTAFKFVISATDPEYNNVQINTDKPIYVQPMDEYDEAKNRQNLEYTRDLALKHGYNISLQLHKILGVE